jgi:hypothetical protein
LDGGKSFYESLPVEKNDFLPAKRAKEAKKLKLQTNLS